MESLPSPYPEPMGSEADLVGAIEELGLFLDGAPLTTTIAQLEQALDGSSRDDLAPLLEAAGVSPQLLRAAVLVRSRVGRINDVIHAAAIALVLPEVLESGEVLKRPSLGAGNDPSRPFDLETDRRVAEFKLAGWKGSDAARKRQTFKDLVHLAAEGSDRKAQLYISGQSPVHFLQSSKATAAWGLDRFPVTRQLFEDHFGSLEISISDFTNGPGAHVELIDIEALLPGLLTP